MPVWHNPPCRLRPAISILSFHSPYFPRPKSRYHVLASVFKSLQLSYATLRIPLQVQYLQQKVAIDVEIYSSETITQRLSNRILSGDWELSSKGFATYLWVAAQSRQPKDRACSSSPVTLTRLDFLQTYTETQFPRQSVLDRTAPGRRTGRRRTCPVELRHC